MFKKLLGAIKSAPNTRTLYKHPQGSWDLMLYVTAQGRMFLEVHNNPFEEDTDALTHAITKGLEKGVMGHKIHFTTDHDKAAHPSYRVIIAFDPPKNYDYKKLAHGDVPPVEDHGDRHTAIAAFCNSDKALIGAAGSVGAEIEPGTEPFHKWFVSFGRQLFPKKKD